MAAVRPDAGHPAEDGEGMGGAARFRRGFFFTSAGTVVAVVSLFLETIIAVRALTTESYGVYVLLVVTVNFLVAAVDFGLQSAAPALLAGRDPQEQGRVASAALTFRAAVLMIVSLALWLGLAVAGRVGAATETVSLAVYLPLMLCTSSLDELLFSLLQGVQAYRQMAAARIVRSVLRVVLSVVGLYALKLGILALIYSWVLSFAVSLVLQYSVLPVAGRFALRRFAVQWQVVKGMLRFSFPLYLSTLVWFALQRIDVVLLGALAGPASVAFYATAGRLPDALQRLSDAYVSVYYPTLSALLKKNRRHEARILVDHSLQLVGFLTAVAALIAVVFGREIMTLVFSERYAVTSKAFGVLMIAFHVTFSVHLLGYALTAAGFPKRSFAASLVQASVNVVGDLALIPIFGFVGPAYASLASVYALAPVAIWLVRRSGLEVTSSPFVKQTVLLLAYAVGVWWLAPQSVLIRLTIVAAFVVHSLAMSTLSPQALTLILPSRVTRRVQHSVLSRLQP
ncbi:MAG: flippase [Anaerolineae bacterium]